MMHITFHLQFHDAEIIYFGGAFDICIGSLTKMQKPGRHAVDKC